ncbi:hypothetical protein KC19_2G242200 [Ceratodon purpureus]|uniref:Secreted protein n=1 Tax=Ceratodon purpureus TaxID=3225 RepID=A0A8T0J0K5_CERPU|nr:hypothetical protein KC19_2G242200 [Ceratodon purpureus]
MAQPGILHTHLLLFAHPHLLRSHLLLTAAAAAALFNEYTLRNIIPCKNTADDSCQSLSLVSHLHRHHGLPEWSIHPLLFGCSTTSHWHRQHAKILQETRNNADQRRTLRPHNLSHFLPHRLAHCKVRFTLTLE